jgi:hypothetical protein
MAQEVMSAAYILEGPFSSLSQLFDRFVFLRFSAALPYKYQNIILNYSTAIIQKHFRFIIP